ncbi:MAG TPA: FimV/HubP family polar landmark protein, partial [Rheinheimera sp.]|nr:FimV/HubP family polar landmark protein [Rheinheimera sp.]
MRTLVASLAFVTVLAQASQPHLVSMQLGPVQDTDTLWQLATQARPDGQVAMVQVVYALWQANPQAFRQQNINMLRLGSQLTVPERSQMLATPVAKARQWYYQAIAAKTGTAAKPAPAVLNDAPVATTIDIADTPSATTVAANAPPVQPAKAIAVTAATAGPADSSATSQSAPADWLQQLSRDYTLTLQQRYYPQQGAQGQAKANTSLAFSAEWVWQSED